MLPILARIGPVSVYSYGVALALAFIAGLLLLRWYLPGRGLDRALALDLVLAAAIGGLVGARTLYVATFWSEFASRPIQVFELWRGGMVFYGGAIGGAIAVTVFALLRKLPIAAVADAAGLTLPLGSAIGRLGCFFNGCCGGRPTTAWYGCTFPGTSGPVVPTQLIDSAADLAIFGLLLYVATRPLARPGIVWWGYLTLYPVSRFLVETLRTTPRYALGLSQAQWISAVVFVIGVAGLVWTLTRPRPVAGGRDPGGRGAKT